MSQTLNNMNDSVIITDKPILDPCCGSKMMWFDKNNPNVMFGDIRTEEHILCDGRTLSITPDIEMDFTKLPFLDETFYLIAWDPPHMNKLGKTSWMAKKYGVLTYHWRHDIKQGFDECMRVLRPGGTLIFKWNESQIKISEIKEIIGIEPTFGHTTGRQAKTIFMTFFKPIAA